MANDINYSWPDSDGRKPKFGDCFNNYRGNFIASENIPFPRNNNFVINTGYFGRRWRFDDTETCKLIKDN